MVRSLILPFPAFTLHAMYTWIHGVFISDWKGEAISASLSGEGRLTANPTSLAVVFMDYFVWILPFPEFRQPLHAFFSYVSAASSIDTGRVSPRAKAAMSLN